MSRAGALLLLAFGDVSRIFNRRPRFHFRPLQGLFETGCARRERTGRSCSASATRRFRCETRRPRNPRPLLPQRLIGFLPHLCGLRIT